MKRDINKAVTAIVFAAVFGGCHNVRETVEEAAVHADVSYELKEPEKEIISTTNDFSFRLCHVGVRIHRDTMIKVLLYCLNQSSLTKMGSIEWCAA